MEWTYGIWENEHGEQAETGTYHIDDAYDEEGVSQGNKHDAGGMYLETKAGRFKFQKTCRS